MHLVVGIEEQTGRIRLLNQQLGENGNPKSEMDIWGWLCRKASLIPE